MLLSHYFVSVAYFTKIHTLVNREEMWRIFVQVVVLRRRIDPCLVVFLDIHILGASFQEMEILVCVCGGGGACMVP